MENNQLKKNPSEREFRDAIDAFDQILEAIPNDRMALETLIDSYEQINDRKKALEYVIRLAEVIEEDRDAETAPRLIEKLRALGANDPSATQTLENLEKLVASARKTPEPTASRSMSVSKRKTIDIAAELALAWTLVQAGELTQEDYSSVVHDLTESSSKNVEVPVTVLHVLHDRAFKNLDKVLTFLSSQSGLPILSLSNFEMQKDTYKLLPEDFMMRRGAIVFELMGRDALVAILNPYDAELRKEVESMTGKECHFYLVSAESYDHCLDLIRTALKAEEAKQKKP
jgi:tetratricopeptide (TPR) repeat protein